MSAAASRFAALGFDGSRFRFTLQTAMAACLALLVAWLIGLEHPQWSAMTVFAASQPARNLLVEKSLFRFLGTLVGTILGVGLVFVSSGEPIVLVVGLSLWIGLCAWAGNLLRGFVAYGALLAGYSASMVALLDTGHPDHILQLGADRLLTVLTGVAVALVIGLIFSPREAEDAVAGRARQLSADLLRRIAARLDALPSRDPAEEGRLLRQLAILDEQLDPHGAGSLRSRRSARSLRGVISALVSGLVWLQGEEGVEPLAEAAKNLRAAAESLDAGGEAGEAIQYLESAAANAGGHYALREMILQLRQALLGRLGVEDGETGRPHAVAPVILHRDWVGARQAALRATGVLLLLGAIWIGTGWTAGPLLLLGTAVMATLFSTWESPAHIMRHVMIGQLFGAGAALLCRWMAWPHAGSEFEMVLMLMGFVVIASLPMSHRRTMLGATDYAMVLLLLSQPSMPLHGTFGESMSKALAVIAAPLIALIAYRFVFPADAPQRMRMLIATMVHELQDLAGSRDAAHHRGAWRARFYHRLLRLVRWAEKSGASDERPARGGLAVFAVGEAVLDMQRLLRRGALPVGLVRSLEMALARIGTIASRPDRALGALDLAAVRLQRAGWPEAELVQAAHRELASNLAFFKASG